MVVFIYSVQTADIFFGFTCSDVTVFIWLSRKTQHQDVESSIAPLQNKKNWTSYNCLVRTSEKMCLSQNVQLCT